MLDTDTKRRIDTARNILVGKVPDPKSQVEQITIALIYSADRPLTSRNAGVKHAESFPQEPADGRDRTSHHRRTK
ncbi:hypothetical protein HY522_02220 [bacterium]|nr:hypothetical protein [bacterium]